ncbi:hypothetical protein ACFL54_05565 [Planctomycetota bacterium]
MNLEEKYSYTVISLGRDSMKCRDSIVLFSTFSLLMLGVICLACFRGRINLPSPTADNPKTAKESRPEPSSHSGPQRSQELGTRPDIPVDMHALQKAAPEETIKEDLSVCQTTPRRISIRVFDEVDRTPLASLSVAVNEDILKTDTTGCISYETVDKLIKIKINQSPFSYQRSFKLAKLIGNSIEIDLEKLMISHGEVVDINDVPISGVTITQQIYHGTGQGRVQGMGENIDWENTDTGGRFEIAGVGAPG